MPPKSVGIKSRCSKRDTTFKNPSCVNQWHVYRGLCRQRQSFSFFERRKCSNTTDTSTSQSHILCTRMHLQHPGDHQRPIPPFLVITKVLYVHPGAKGFPLPSTGSYNLESEWTNNRQKLMQCDTW